jgi:hypothetical protein
MKHNLIPVVVLLLLVTLAIFYYYGRSTVPSGQAPLLRLSGSNVAVLKDAFNRSAGFVRLLVLLSPT